MASTTTLFTGLSGILSHSRLLDVVGNNIANVNTMGYKATRAQFAPNFSRTASQGSAPSDVSGGANPAQIGLGVNLSGTQRDFSSGALTVTGKNSNMAIEGSGLFILDVSGEQRYSRDGNFSLNSEHELVSMNGGKVQGYGIDQSFNLQTGSMSGITVPLGSLTVAEATENVRFRGNLNAGGDPGSLGTQITSAAMRAIAGAVPAPSNAPFADATTRLVDLSDGTGSPLFAINEIVRLSGAEKDGRILPDADFNVDNTVTMQDLMTFFEQALGIDISVPGDPGGVTIDATTGVVTIEGNYGTSNELTVQTGDIAQLDPSGAPLGQPFTLTKAQEAAGESVRTTFRGYDSLGNSIDVNLTMVLVGKSNAGTSWRYYADSPDDVSGASSLGTGTMAFDTTGRLIPPTQFDIIIDRSGTGADSPLSITLDLDEESDIVTSLAGGQSEIAATYQDGSPLGTLADFAVEGDGTITGAFSNGLLRTVGQLVVAEFTNPEGLIDLGNLQYQEGPNSGDALITTPLLGGTGRIVSGSLELSNVDLSQEFINLILAQTGYSASSRIINTANTLFQQLLVIGR